MQYSFTIRKKDKGYQVIVNYKLGNKWKQKSKQGFTTQREAKLHGQQIVEQLKNVVPTKHDEDITFIQLYNMYIDEKQELSPNTKRTYNNVINAYCKSLWNVSIKDITHSTLVQLLNGMNVSVATKNLCLVLLKAMFKHAISPYGFLSKSPCIDLKRFRSKDRTSVNVISHDDFKTLLQAIKQTHPRFYLLCMVARYTGARYGEIIALTWNDINFTDNTISISKQWTFLGDKRYGFGVPKSKNSIRTIPIPNILADELIWNVGPGDTRLFPFRTNRTSQLNALIQKHIPNTSIHVFRHTYATTLLANGVDIQTVASLLGDNVNTVMNTYIHYCDEMRRKASKHIANIFG